MALPSNGVISLNDVRKELNVTGPISLGDSNVRQLAGISSGKISLLDLKGKSSIQKTKITVECDWFLLNAGSINITFYEWGYRSKEEGYGKFGKIENDIIFDSKVLTIVSSEYFVEMIAFENSIPHKEFEVIFNNENKCKYYASDDSNTVYFGKSSADSELLLLGYENQTIELEFKAIS